MLFITKKQLLSDIENGVCVHLRIELDDLGICQFKEKIIAVDSSGQHYAVLSTSHKTIRYFNASALTFIDELNLSIPVTLAF